MTTITFARHGETVWHAENRYAGSSDVGLTDRGRQQARLLGEWARGTELHAIVTSDLDRSARTAAPAAAASGLSPVVEPRLREVHFGAGEGLTKQEMRERFPEAVERFHRRPADEPFPGGERGSDAVRRALPAVWELVERFPDGRVLVVGHSTLNRLLFCRLLGIDANRYRTLFPAVRNVALTTLELAGPPEDSVALLEFNVPPS